MNYLFVRLGSDFGMLQFVVLTLVLCSSWSDSNVVESTLLDSRDCVGEPVQTFDCAGISFG